MEDNIFGDYSKSERNVETNEIQVQKYSKEEDIIRYKDLLKNTKPGFRTWMNRLDYISMGMLSLSLGFQGIFITGYFAFKKREVFSDYKIDLTLLGLGLGSLYFGHRAQKIFKKDLPLIKERKEYRNKIKELEQELNGT